MTRGRPKGSKNKTQTGKYIQCPTCKKIFYVSKCRVGERIHCSNKCYNHMTEETKNRIRLSHINGIKIGDTRKWSGYIYVYQPKHPKAIKGYVKRATLVIEKHLGRYIKSPELVHHKGIHFSVNSSKNKEDDSFENLQLCADNSEHRRCNHKQ